MEIFVNDQAANWVPTDFQSRNVSSHSELTSISCVAVMNVCVCSASDDYVVLTVVSSYVIRLCCDTLDVRRSLPSTFSLEQERGISYVYST